MIPCIEYTNILIHIDGVEAKPIATEYKQKALAEKYN